MRIVATSLVFAALASSAFAADLPTKASPSPVASATVVSWTGPYIGANIGGGFGNSGSDVAGGNAIGNLLVSSGLIPNHLNTQGGGVVGGGQIGYNRQSGPWVLGLEADIQASGISGKDSKGNSLVPAGVNLAINTIGEKKLNWYGDLVGRAGYLPFDERFLVYAKGGLAFGDVSHTTTTALSGLLNASASSSESSVRTGYTVGGGMDWKLAYGWTAGVDYSYIDFGKKGAAYGANVLGTTVNLTGNSSDTFHVGKIKLSRDLPVSF